MTYSLNHKGEVTLTLSPQESAEFKTGTLVKKVTADCRGELWIAVKLTRPRKYQGAKSRFA